jgi:hypothetical protein
MSTRPAITLASLARYPSWVSWRPETRGGLTTKVPYDPRTGRRAASDDPNTWATYNEAQDWVAANVASGVGLMFSQIDDKLVCGIDLDTCRNRDTEAIEPWAQAVIDRVPLNDDERQLSSLVKFVAYPRPGRHRGSRPTRAYPLPADRVVELTTRWSRYAITDFLFLYGARRRGPSIVVDE